MTSWMQNTIFCIFRFKLMSIDYQISIKKTLGVSEQEIIENIKVVFMYVTKNGVLKRFCNIFNFENERYLKLREEIPILKDNWI